jgi:hypothetical protein
MVAQYRGQPWQQSPQERKYDATQQYQEYLRQLQQQYQNQAQAIYNTQSTQQANERLSNLGLNFAGDAGQQALTASRMRGDISELAMRQQQARDNMLLDLAQLRHQREQTKLNMADDLQQLKYNRGTQQVPHPFEVAMKRGGY